MDANNENLAVPLTAGELQGFQSEQYLNLRQKAATGIVWSAAQKYGERAVSFVVLLFLVRLLSPTAFGLVALASVFITFAQIFIDQGFSDAVVQTPTIDQTLLNTAFWTNLIASIIIAFGSIALSPLISRLYGEPRLISIIRWLSIGFVLNALSSVQVAILRRELNFRSLAIRSLIAAFGSGLVAVVLAALGAGVWTLVVRMLLSTLISVLVLWGISRWRPGFSFSMECFRKLYSYGISIVGANFVDFFSRHSDDLLIGFFLGATALGYYGLAYGLLLTLTDMLIVVPNSVVFPALSRIRNDVSRLRASVYEATQIISIITIPFFACIMILAPDVVQLLYGSQWNSSIPVLQVLMLVGMVHSSFFFFGSLLKAVGKPHWRFAMLSLTALLNILGFAISVRWGIVAVAASYACVAYLVAPVYLELVRRAADLDIRIYLKQYVPAIICTGLMSMVVFATKYALEIQIGLYLRVAVMILLAASSYLLSVFLFARPVFYRAVSLAADIVPRTGPFSSRFQRYKNKGKSYE